MSKWKKYLEMSLIGEYLNSVKSERQKPNFGLKQLEHICILEWKY